MSRVADGALRAVGENAGDFGSKDAPHHIVFDHDQENDLGPLNGIRIVEFAGIGPGPMAAMLLADLGATVLRLDRTVPSDLGVALAPRFDLFMRGRSSVAVDLKHPAGVEFALKLLDAANASIEGFRP